MGSFRKRSSSAHFQLISMQSICCLCWMPWTVKQYLSAPTGSMDCLVPIVWPLKLKRSLLPQLGVCWEKCWAYSKHQAGFPKKQMQDRGHPLLQSHLISEAFQWLSVARATKLCTSSSAYVIWSFHNKTPEHPFVLSRLAFVSVWDRILGMPGNYAS